MLAVFCRPGMWFNKIQREWEMRAFNQQNLRVRWSCPLHPLESKVGWDSQLSDIHRDLKNFCKKSYKRESFQSRCSPECQAELKIYRDSP